MYVLIFIIIVVNLLLFVTWDDEKKYLYAPKPKSGAGGSGSCPSGQKKQGNQCVPSGGSSGGCPSGQKKQGNKCVPSGGSSGGSSGGCPSGQKKQGNKCVPFGGSSGGGSSGGCPFGQKKQGNKCVPSGGSGSGGSVRPDIGKLSFDGKPPSASRLENAVKFFTKYPGRVNNPPAAYAGLIQAGYIQQIGNSWTVNPSPPQTTGGGGGSSGTGGSGGYKPPPGKLSGGLSNQAWDDYNNKYSDKTKVGNARVVLTDTRNDRFGSDPKKVAEYNRQLAAQGKIPMAYMNTGMVDTPGQYGNDKAFDKLYKDLKAAGVVGPKDPRWEENILDGKKLLNDPSAMAKVKAAYTDYVKAMKGLGYQAINVDNLDFYDKGPNSKLSKADQQKLGLSWQSMVADVIHSQGLYAVAKNAPDLATMPGSTYVSKWDGIVTENAVTSGWDDSSAYKKFADAGKPVWNFQTKTAYSKYDTPGWMDTYAVGQGKQGWWAT